MNEREPVESKRPRNELQSLLLDIDNAHSALSCTVGEEYTSSVLTLNDSFQRLVDGYLKPSTGSSLMSFFFISVLCCLACLCVVWCSVLLTIVFLWLK